MHNHHVLEEIAIGYSPVLDAKRAVMATRLTVFPLRPEAPPSAANLLAVVAEVWPGDASRVMLNIASEAMLRELLRVRPASHLMVEVPAFMAADAECVPLLLALRAAGNTLLLKGRPVVPLPREVLPCFRYALVDLGEERRGEDPAATAFTRTLEFMQVGVTTAAEAELSFRRGAKAVVGWPMPETGAAPKKAPAGMQAVVDLIQGLDREEPADKLELRLKRDPSLAFRLMRYINSPAFGLSVEINSFRHAIMILGYQRMKRWLALLLATATDDPVMRPLMFASVRRGLMMEELVRHHGDETLGNELFICGVFSLLDRMFGRPIDELLSAMPVPERVMQALVHGTGPFKPYLDLVESVEQASVYDLRAAADALLMTASEVNRALLHALGAAQQVS